MAYNSIHSGPAVDAAVASLNEIQTVRTEVSGKLDQVDDLASQAAIDRGLAVQAKDDAQEAQTLADQRATDAQGSATAAEQARTASVTAKTGAEQARDSAAADAERAEIAAAQASQIALGDAIDDEHASPNLVFSSEKVESEVRGLREGKVGVEALARSILSFGEVGKGQDDTSVFEAARDWGNLQGQPVHVPPGEYLLSRNVSGNFTKDPGAVFPGSGYLRLNHANTPKLGQRQVHMDMTVQPGAYDQAASLNNYKTLNEFAGISIVSNVFDGYQGALSTDSGARTNFPVFHTSGSFSGEGDSISFFASRGISRHSRWQEVAGSWTGQNSIQLFAGHAGANTGNVNIYGAEFSITDNGPGKPNVTGIGLVISLNRNDATADLRQTWQGIRLQAGKATAVPDCGLNMSSTWKNGIDLTGADFTGAAIALKTGQRIYLNCDHTSPASSWYCGQNGTSLKGQYLDAAGNRIRIVSDLGADLVSNDASASAGPDMRLLRDSASPAAFDTLGRVLFTGKDAANAVTNYAAVTSILVSPNDAAERGSLWFQTIYDGAFATRMRIDNGVQVGSAVTGGDKGVGTINLQSDLYVQGVKVLGARKAGWAAATGSSSRAAYDTSSVTLQELAQRVKALQDDLTSHGLIGA